MRIGSSINAMTSFTERSEAAEDLEMLLEEEQKFWRYVESGRNPPLILPEI